MRTLLIFLFPALLFGCASTPVSISEAVDIAPARYQLYGDRRPGTAEVTITRDKGFIGAGCPTSITVNGKPAASIRPGEKATLYVPPGEVIFGADPGMCGGSRSEVGATLVGGQPAYLRLSADQSGAVTLQKTIAR